MYKYKILIPLVLLTFVTTLLLSKESLDLEPRYSTRTGPRFEGFYIRITGTKGKESVAVIGGVFLPEGEEFNPEVKLKGYIALLVGDGESTKSYESFPENITIESNGKKRLGRLPVLLRPFGPKAKFRWSSLNFGVITEKFIDIKFPDGPRLSATIKKRLPWNSDGVSGPEGTAAYIPGIPLHWYVYSLGSKASYKYLLEDDPRRYRKTQLKEGIAHVEKNWGAAFPTAWIWSEAVLRDNRAQFALAGGRLNLAGVELTTWLVGFRSKKVSWDFRQTNPGTVFSSEINGCKGEFSLTAKNIGKRKLVISAKADPSSFARVSIPTVNGFIKDGGVESFSATIQVSAYKYRGILEPKLVDEVTFTGGALEFGADYMCGRNK